MVQAKKAKRTTTLRTPIKIETIQNIVNFYFNWHRNNKGKI